MISQDLSGDTIVAVATPPGEGGVGILRLSGSKAPEALQKIWRGRTPVTEFQSHRLYLGDFADPVTEETIDRGLAVWMRAPASYTGEEVVELHAHGGPLILNRLLEVLVHCGLRPAEPGEFTRRAFMNGKMDLLQAEAVGAMIQAKSEAALRNARAQLAGRLSQEIDRYREAMIALLARVEAAIDFPEEDIQILAPAQTSEAIASLEATLRDWLEKFQWGRLLREGVRLALVGRPNVGKSSLLNRLLGEERAIVHEQAGTTRDVLEGWVSWEGVPFQVYDTAGIRESEEPVEREGIHRSREAARRADLTLWVLDGSTPATPEDRRLAESLQGRVLIVANKSDLGTVFHAWPGAWPALPPNFHGEWAVVSAKTGEGLESLKRAVLRAVGSETIQGLDHAYLNNARHREALHQALEALGRARAALAEGLPAECTADDLRLAIHAMGALLGKVSTEDVLDKIFRDFCIGK
jgi:tRNA modification GTPase